ncbi:hypothetical protein [Jatrophihabitans sp.]|uniref:hypothetical protein n=1 Tax=Jatrophihabitans sp. TaxID=1932789 RepID=UPI002B756A9D|nr:hypothetical protein [Jatrophihabitans sp.]
MSEGRCGVNISQVREIVGDEGQWLDKFEDSCCLDAGHEGQHVFNSADDDEHLRYDEANKQFGSYRDAPAEGAQPMFKLEPVEATGAP